MDRGSVSVGTFLGSMRAIIILAHAVRVGMSIVLVMVHVLAWIPLYLGGVKCPQER